MERTFDCLIRGVREDYKFDSFELVEEQEEMNVLLHKRDHNGILIIQPQNDERDFLWRCYSNQVERGIADYIIFKRINHKIVAFIIEMKKRKTDDNTKKAKHQIISTYPKVIEIYGKITGNWTENLEVVGLRLFGAPRTKKVSNAYKLGLPEILENGKLPVANFTLNKNGEKLIPLQKLYGDIQALGLN